MTSIYQMALGSDFQRLHPKIQERFSFSSADGIACVATGVMDEISHGGFYLKPFLYLGLTRRIMFPEKGRNIPFTLMNHAYTDSFGRETISWIREFQFENKIRRFDDQMVYSRERNRIINYFGTHQNIAIDVEFSVDERGGLVLKSGIQRFYAGPLAFTVPTLLAGVAHACEWYDDSAKKYCFEIKATNKLCGPLFGYRGSFQCEFKSISTAEIPTDAMPIHEERRE